MMNQTLSVAVAEPKESASTTATPRRSTALLILSGLWLIIFLAALFAPPLLDDADATHASAARNMALTGDLVTLRVDGVRYLEKPPLPYWLVALSFRIFGFNTFAAHLPQAIGVLLLALLGYFWSERAFNTRTAFYTGLAILTCVGVFLFTRYFIPEVLLSLLLCTALYCFLQSLNSSPPSSKEESVILSERGARVEGPAFFTPATHAYLMWTALALAVLTKGLVALVFFFGTATIYLALTGEYKKWRQLKLLTGTLLFLAIAAPWHILAGLRNTGGMNGHGFFWFYFVNEHFLRFLGKRFPKDYNKLPGYLYWTLHIVWLFPWSLFLPVAIRETLKHRHDPSPVDHRFGRRTTLLLALFTALVLIFFSLSTNQEYYTFPAYLPLLILIAASLTRAEDAYSEDKSSRRWITFAHATLTILGLVIALVLVYGLWTSRHIAFVPDIGDLLAHRNVSNYTLSMASLFDLTGPSFAALRLPATLAALAFLIGPATAWFLRSKKQHLAATTAIALTSATFLIAANIAFARFAPMLSSKSFADTIQQLEADHAISPDNEILLYGDQAYGSSIPFYLGREVYLVEGRSTSMLFGSTFPDAPPIFLTAQDLANTWGKGARKILFVPIEKHEEVDHLLGNNKLLLKESSGKVLYTDRPLDK
jgi:4-amino-4-deoxy-L-arabinose transferase-like glycosyltransferase